jgi:dihydrofolate reductase
MAPLRRQWPFEPVQVSLIWAMTRNRVIGQGNGLPWRLPKDMQFFMKTTMGHPVIMGRKTFETMKAPLPGRTNVVVTRDSNYHREGVLAAGDLRSALDLAEAQARQDGLDEVFVAGGAEIYRLALEVATRLYVTEIDAELAGDTFFPELDWTRWVRLRSERFTADASHAFGFTISVFERA